MLVDRSGSMFSSRLSDRSELTRADAAAVFGAAVAVRRWRCGRPGPTSSSPAPPAGRCGSVHTWNLAGYRADHGPSGTANRHVFAGLSDAAFRMVPLLEAGRNADWPWTTV